MPKYKLAQIRPVNAALSKADIPGYFQAIEPYLISHDPHVVVGESTVLDTLEEISKTFQVQARWEIVAES